MKVEIVKKAPSETWELCELQRPPMSVGIDSSAEIMVYRIKKEDATYYKPYQPYFNAEFEALFQFGIGCSGYDANRIVKVFK